MVTLVSLCIVLLKVAVSKNLSIINIEDLLYLDTRKTEISPLKSVGGMLNSLLLPRKMGVGSFLPNAHPI